MVNKIELAYKNTYWNEIQGSNIQNSPFGGLFALSGIL